MRQLIECIVKALVDVPEDAVVTEVSGEQTSIMQIRVAKSDIGKVLGKDGRIIDSIRIIMGAAGKKLNRRYSLSVLE